MNNSSVPIISMVIQSGPFARIILISIALFSIVSLGVIIFKLFYYRNLYKKNKLFLDKFYSQDNFRNIKTNQQEDQKGTLVHILKAALQEFERIIKTMMTYKDKNITSFFVETQFSIIKDNIEKAASEETQKADNYLVILAITGSISPLLGLLGTVWGIMRAFSEIGIKGTASLNVVAPGIAEALITTICGIAVAIPSVIFYNYFSNKNRELEEEHYNFSAHLSNKIKSDFFDIILSKKEE